MSQPATENYAILGGKSPLLELTQEQAGALDAELGGMGVEAKCFIAMRYWHPFSDEAARAVREWGPDEVLLLPLYPQFSTTTTGSSLIAWRQAAVQAGLARKVTTLCCWFGDGGYIAATAAIVRRALDEARAATNGAGARAVLRARVARGDRAAGRSVPVSGREHGGRGRGRLGRGGA